MIELNLHKKLRSTLGEMELQFEGTIHKGEVVSLYGKSGAGKTSILRMIAGLMNPDKGKIKVFGKTWMDDSEKINLKPRKRSIGYVFQDYALFPNMSVLQNLEFALSKEANKTIISELIEIMEIGELRYQKPGTLSGGQQQRVALARALVQKPQLLLLDEALSAVDHQMRLKLQDYILQVHKAYDLTTILISHDLPEILRMTQKVFAIDQGKIIQQGTPTEVFGYSEMNGCLKVQAEILNKEFFNQEWILTALIGNQILKMTIPESQAKQLAVGDKVEIKAEDIAPQLSKRTK